MSEGSAAPGWYHAEGDPPGTERYWDGTAWTDGPRPIAQSFPPPVAPPGPPGSDMPAMPGTQAQPSPTPWSNDPVADALPGSAGMQPPPTFQGAPGFAVSYPEESKAVTALVLSIVGLMCCGVPAGIGAYMANEERKAIDAGLRDPAKRGMVVTALVIAILGLTLWGFVYGLWFLGALLA